MNLDLAPGFTAIRPPVQPGHDRPVHRASFPASLVRPDRNNFAPRLGIAWKPLSKTVVRAGYGINYNTSAYQSIAQNMAFQPPFSTTADQRAVGERHSSLCRMDFRRLPPGSITNNFAVNPNYRLGYVQIWNLDIQQEIRPTLLLNLDYTGTKGTRSRYAGSAESRTATACASPACRRSTRKIRVGDSSANAGSVRLRKRLQPGLSVGGTYTFSKSLDNASTIGSGAALVGPARHAGVGHHARRAECLRPGSRARAFQLRSAAQVHRRLPVGAALRT